MRSGVDYYALLGLTKDATSKEIQRAYHLAARRLHPDVNKKPGETEIFLEIQEAYSILSDPQRREAYDQTLSSLKTEPLPVVVNTQYSCSALPINTDPQLLHILIVLSPGQVDFISPPSPLNLCLALDCSTSMHGDRLDVVKSTAIGLLRQLRPQDTLSIVTFNDRAKVLLPAGYLGERDRIETEIRLLSARGGTEIYSGLEAALFEVRRNMGAASTSHIILITDGRTYGDETNILQLARQAAAQGIGITSLGIGAEWNDVLLEELASRTGGSSHYIDQPGDIELTLLQKVRNLSQAYAERITAIITTRLGVELRQVFRLEPEANAFKVEFPMHLGSIPKEGQLSLLLEFLVAPVQLPAAKIELAEILFTLDIPAQSLQAITLPVTLNLPLSNATDPGTPPGAIAQALANLALYRLQEKARQEVANGNLDEAHRNLSELASRLDAQGKTELANTVLLEAEHLQRSRTFSQAGEKRIKYGTRALLLTATTAEDNLALLLVASGQVLPLTGRDTYTLGRVGPGQPVVPNIDLGPYGAQDNGVSRLHATLRVTPQLTITDRGSTNGTQVNGKTIPPHNACPISNGDVLTLGRLQIQILCEDHPEK